MKSLRRFLGLNRNEKRLWSTALLWVVAVRLALWLLPFRLVHGLISRLMRNRQTARVTDPLNKVAWAVRSASRYVPSATCLTQALATYLMLGKCGQPVILYLGVFKTSTGSFKAHAWVESEGKVLVGYVENFGNYVPMRLMYEKNR